MAASYVAVRPPGPRGRNLLSSVLALRRHPAEGLLRARREYGDLVFFPLGRRSFYLVSHPRDVARVLHENHGNYRKTTRTYAKIRDLLGDGLVTSDGATWRRQRSLVQPAFHQRQVARFAGTVTDMTARALDRWEPRRRRGQPIDFGAEMRRLTLGIVGRALFGTDVGHDRDSIGHDITCALDHTSHRAEAFFDLPRLPTPRQRRFRRALPRLDRVVHRLIDQRRRDPGDRNDLLSILLGARDEETGQGLSDAEIRDQVLTLLLAGHETTATALTWTAYLLTRHPDVQDRVRDDLPDHPFTRRVLQESMRLFPPFWSIERSAATSDTLAGHTIPAGATITLSQYVTHRDPGIWPDPDRFDPDRFLPDQVAARPRYAYFPFGGGPRACIGAGFAMAEAQLILSMLVHRYRLSLEPEQRVRTAAGITLRPRSPILMRLT